MDGDTQSLKFDYNFFGDIKVNLDLESSVDVDNWRISARSPLKVYNIIIFACTIRLQCII